MSFRDNYAKFTRANVQVLGVSPDGVESHREFKAKNELPFPLLADTDHSVADAYNVWRERSAYGKTYMGIERSTFLIGAGGTIKRVWRGVKPDMHAEQVLDAMSD